MPLVKRAEAHANEDYGVDVGLVNALRAVAHDCLVATDGSCVGKRSAKWGVAVACANWSVGHTEQRTVPGADQSSWATELEAATQLLRAAKVAGRRDVKS